MVYKEKLLNPTQPNSNHAPYFVASEIQLISAVCVSIDGATPTEYTRDELLPPNAFDEAEENERKLDAVEYEHEEVHHRRVHHPTRPQVGPERVIVTKWKLIYKKMLDNIISKVSALIRIFL